MPNADVDPSWSVDAKQIAFVSSRNGGWEIFTMNADGTGVTRLTNNSDDEFRPSWGR
jgi:Tol biopolymer transport system component